MESAAPTKYNANHSYLDADQRAAFGTGDGCNLLTGTRQKVANYAGVTIERKEGHYFAPSGRSVRVLDLPGAYSLAATSPDEAITRDVITGRYPGEAVPDLIVCVADATNLRLHLRFVLEIARLGQPMLLALNMMDAAKRRGIRIDTAALAQKLGMPVVETVAIKHGGAKALIDAGADALTLPDHATGDLIRNTMYRDFLPVRADVVARLAHGAARGVELPDGALRSLVVDGVFAGLGTVLAFLPQILILFLFILCLEESGYLPRAAFLLDRMMLAAGLTGRSFIPLLSSFACAIPGIMATRSIPDPRDRLTTILIAPLMTCSARLPVYALLIAAFPGAPAGATDPAIDYSLAGMIGRMLHTVFAPLGFNWQICIALVPGLAAREVAVSSLATVYALAGNEDGLQAIVASQWSLATALSLLAWYVFAPMCISTLATVKRETGSVRNVVVLAGYLFGLAYLASFATYQIAKALS